MTHNMISGKTTELVVWPDNMTFSVAPVENCTDGEQTYSLIITDHTVDIDMIMVTITTVTTQDGVYKLCGDKCSTSEHTSGGKLLLYRAIDGLVKISNSGK